jgi:hypothetical protein
MVLYMLAAHADDLLRLPPQVEMHLRGLSLMLRLGLGTPQQSVITSRLHESVSAVAGIVSTWIRPALVQLLSSQDPACRQLCMYVLTRSAAQPIKKAAVLLCSMAESDHSICTPPQHQLWAGAPGDALAAWRGAASAASATLRLLLQAGIAYNCTARTPSKGRISVVVHVLSLLPSNYKLLPTQLV